jgi:hypothetical protein
MSVAVLSLIEIMASATSATVCNVPAGSFCIVPDVVLAFEWSNFRLARALMNSRKNKFEDVLDPFEVENGWFFVNQLNGSIRPASGIPNDVTKQVKDTIDRLGLDHPDCRKARVEHIDMFHRLGRNRHYIDSISPLLAEVL